MLPFQWEFDRCLISQQLLSQNQMWRDLPEVRESWGVHMSSPHLLLTWVISGIVTIRGRLGGSLAFFHLVGDFVFLNRDPCPKKALETDLTLILDHDSAQIKRIHFMLGVGKNPVTYSWIIYSFSWKGTLWTFTIHYYSVWAGPNWYYCWCLWNYTQPGWLDLEHPAEGLFFLFPMD